MKEGARGDEEREDVSWLLGAGGSPPIIAAPATFFPSLFGSCLTNLATLLEIAKNAKTF